jgi:hypothetical protein
MSKSVQAELFADSLCTGGLEGEALRRSFAADTPKVFASRQLPLEQGFRYQLCHVLWACVAQIGDLVPATCA